MKLSAQEALNISKQNGWDGTEVSIREELSKVVLEAASRGETLCRFQLRDWRFREEEIIKAANRLGSHIRLIRKGGVSDFDEFAVWWDTQHTTKYPSSVVFGLDNYIKYRQTRSKIC